MSYEFVFVRSIVLTIIIGLFLLVTGRARSGVASWRSGCSLPWYTLFGGVYPNSKADGAKPVAGWSVRGSVQC